MMYRLQTLLLACLIAASPALLARASQNNVYLPTTGTYTSLQAVNFMNDAWDALLTCNKGNVAPTNALGGAAKAGQCWLDDSNASLLVKKRFSGSAWVVEGVIDVSNGLWVPPVGGGASTVLSAATTDLCASPQSVQTITSTNAISSFGSNCLNGVRKTLIFQASLTIAYNATSLILPGQRDYVTSAGDVIEVVSLGSGNWRALSISPISGNAVVNPAVDVGITVSYFGGAVPAKYVLGFGQALSRTSFPDYLAAVTKTQSAVRSSGNATLTSVSDTSRFGAGMPIEGTGIPNGTTIVSVTSSTITMSANASSSGTSNATIFLTGYGASGSNTTVGVPDCRGRSIAGRDDMGGTAATRLTSSFFGTSANSMNANGGSENVPMAIGNLIQHDHDVFLNDPGHTHSLPSQGFTLPLGGSPSSVFSSGSSTSGSSTTGITVRSAASGGGTPNKTATTGSASPTPMRTVQPTLIADCMIRVLAMNGTPSLPFNNDNGAIPSAVAVRLYA